MKARSIIVVLITLIIGFILGMLTSAEIRYHKLRPVRVYFSEERFRDGFFRAIQPDKQQKEKIDMVLDKYAKINSELQNNFRKELDANMKDFRKEVDLNLTKDQIARLKEMDERRQEMIRQYRKNHENDTLNSRGDRYHNPQRRPGPGGPHPPFPEFDTTRLPGNK
jgi:hypothetical protein